LEQHLDLQPEQLLALIVLGQSYLLALHQLALGEHFQALVMSLQ
jgi:hypothetical protein